jgi:hypothetical protein
MNPISKEVNVIRARIEALQGERRRAWSQPRSRKEVGPWTRNYIARLHAEAEQQARRALRQLAAGHREVDPLDGDVVAGEVALARALVGLLGVEKVEGVLLRHLDEEVPVGLDQEERNQRLFEIDEELTALEVREEELIEQSEAEGAPVARRSDAKPEIVLGARDPLPDPAPRSPFYTAHDAEPGRGAPRAVLSTYVGSSRD